MLGVYVSAALGEPRYVCFFFFFSSRRRHTRLTCDWSSDVCSSDLATRLNTPSALCDRAAKEHGAEGVFNLVAGGAEVGTWRSEERRVGKEGRCRWSVDH